MNTARTVFALAALALVFVVVLVHRSGYPLVSRLVIGGIGIALLFGLRALAYRLWED